MFQLITPSAGKPFTIGRKATSDLHFEDVFVSREHAVIEKCGDEWHLRSLTQNSVTKLNDQDVTETPLKDGDIIVIGVRRLRVTLSNGDLSLLLLDQEDNVNSIALSDSCAERSCSSKTASRSKSSRTKSPSGTRKSLLPEASADSTST